MKKKRVPKSKPQPWHKKSVEAWEKFGVGVATRRRKLKTTQQQAMEKYKK